MDDNEIMYECWNNLPLNVIHVATDCSFIPDTDLGAGAAIMPNSSTNDDHVIVVGSKCSATEG